MPRTKERIFLPEDPIYKNKTTKCSFYNSVRIIPPYDYYAFIDVVPGLMDYRWDVAIGDTVAVQIEENDESVRENYFPFNSPWWPVTVVSIWKHNPDDKKEQVKLEVRWYCRAKETIDINSSSSNTSTNSKLDELLESEHTDEIDAIALLAPIQLLSSVQEMGTPTFEPIPVTKFVCNKFWSYGNDAVRSDISDFTPEARRRRGIECSKKIGYKLNMQRDENALPLLKNSEKHLGLFAGDVRMDCPLEKVSNKRTRCVQEDNVKVVSP